MPFEPEIEAAGKIAAAVEKSGGVAKAAEEAVAGVEKAAQNASKEGGFVSKAVNFFKSGAKTAAAAATGATAESILSGSKNNSNNGSNNTSNSGPSSYKQTANPGANSPAGRIDLPTITPAEDIAGTVDASSFEDTRGVKGSWGAAGGDSLSNRKLNRIITLLESILTAEKSTAKLIGTGFRGLSQIQIEGINAQVTRQQASDMENSSSGGNKFFSSVMQNPVSTGMSTLKGLGAAALGAFALGAVIDQSKHFMDGDKSQPSQTTQNANDIFEKYKDKYGKRWAQELVHEVEGQFQNRPDFQKALASSHLEAGADIYRAIEKMADFNKVSADDQKKILQQIASLLKIDPSKLQQRVEADNKSSSQYAHVISHGVASGLMNGTTRAVTGLQELAGLVGGGAMSDLGSALKFVGANKLGGSLQQKGNDLTDMEFKSAHEAQAQVKRWNNDSASLQTKIDITNHPFAYRASEISTDAALNLFGAGKMGLLGKGLLFGIQGFGDSVEGMGKYDVFNAARSSSIDFNQNSKAGSVKSLLNFLGKSEGAGYNTIYGGKRINLTGMTLDQVLAYQKKMVESGSPSSAVGKYQFIRKTLEGLKNKLHLSGSEKFSAELQDRLGTELLNEAGLQKFQNGQMNAESFEKNISSIWASVPTENGRSNYEGVAGNHARTTYSDTMNAIAAVGPTGSLENLKPQTQVASAAPVSSPVMINQGGTNISRNTTIQNASAVAPPWLQDNVTASFG